jgi:hypothetical protein
LQFFYLKPFTKFTKKNPNRRGSRRLHEPLPAAFRGPRRLDTNRGRRAPRRLVIKTHKFQNGRIILQNEIKNINKKF